jgi:uncharacterized membrane protein YeaQ/YmgE (transglycosylase-associated protein family)
VADFSDSFWSLFSLSGCCGERDRKFATAPTSARFAITLRNIERLGAVPSRAVGLLQEIIMSLLAWIVLGLVAGFISSKIVNRRGEGIILDVLLGVVGAVVGGWLFRAFGMSGVSGLNLYSALVAIIGATLVLLAYHAIFRSSRFERI